MEIIGKKYNLITIKNIIPVGRGRSAECVCDCGKEFIFHRIDKILLGKQKSCGCLSFKHGLTKSKEYVSWRKMKERCKGLDDVHKRCYKDKGVIVCERWVNSFENFIEDMGFAPSPKHTVDRIDSNGNYEPSNCRWATKEIQSKNCTSNVWIEYKNEKLILKDWCKKYRLEYSTVSKFIKYSIKTPEEIIRSGKHRIKTRQVLPS
jgi:hypothetical protein